MVMKRRSSKQYAKRCNARFNKMPVVPAFHHGENFVNVPREFKSQPADETTRRTGLAIGRSSINDLDNDSVPMPHRNKKTGL